jgi:GH24 family phage-related lysozyme (muramidase)
MADSGFIGLIPHLGDDPFAEPQSQPQPPPSDYSPLQLTVTPAAQYQGQGGNEYTPQGYQPPLNITPPPPLEEYYYNKIKDWEGFQRVGEWDYHQYSNGYGTRAAYPGEVIDRDTADSRFKNEISKAADLVDSRFPGLPQGTRSALTDLTYNSGPAWMNERLGKEVANGNLDAASRLFLQYNHAGGQQLSGLTQRRMEGASWMGGETPPAPQQGVTSKQSPQFVQDTNGNSYPAHPVDYDPWEAAAEKVRRRYPTREPGPMMNAAYEAGDNYAQGLLNFVQTPQQGYQHGLTPEQEIGFGVNAALSSGAARMPFAKPGTLGSAGGAITIPERATAPRFYSTVSNTIDAAKQNVAHPNQWLGMIKNAPGVKPEELKWTGVEDWLKDQGNRPVSKQELSDYMREQQVELGEETKGVEPSREALQRSEDLREQLNRVLKENDWLGFDNPSEARKEILMGHPEAWEWNKPEDLKLAQDYKEAANNSRRVPALHSDPRLQLPGGKNYQEKVLTLPTVHVMPITPEMRKSALHQGFPLFQSGAPIAPPFKLVPVDYDPHEKRT